MTANFYKVEGECDIMLSCPTSVALGLMEFNVDPIAEISQKNISEETFEEYNDGVQSIVKMKDIKVKLHIDESVPPGTADQEADSVLFS